MTTAALRLSAGKLAPGLAVGLALAILAKLLSQTLHAPAPLIAVVLGMMLGALGLQAQLGAGLDIFAKPGLRLGVAMMGAQISWAEFAALGGPAILASGVVVLGGLAIGAAAGLALGLPFAEALIAAAACSICGASAALAASQAAPSSPENQRTTALVIVGVNLLSTVAMLAYPPVANALGVEGPANDVVADARQILHPTAAQQHHRMFLQIMPFAGDIAGDFKTVGQAHFGNFTQR